MNHMDANTYLFTDKRCQHLLKVRLWRICLKRFPQNAHGRSLHIVACFEFFNGRYEVIDCSCLALFLGTNHCISAWLGKCQLDYSTHMRSDRFHTPRVLQEHLYSSACILDTASCIHCRSTDTRGNVSPSRSPLVHPERR